MNYLTQTANDPLFSDLLWSKPENKAQAGNLLIAGGNSFGFADVAKAYEDSLKAGAGESKVLLPDIVQKIAGGVFEHALFAPTNPSGSFSKEGLSSWLEAAQWAHGVLMPGDMSRNAETASLIETFSQDYKGVLVATKDAAELLIKHAPAVLQRPHTTIIITMAELQLVAKAIKFSEPLTFESPGEVFVQRLDALGKKIRANIVIKRHKNVYVLADGKISQTKVGDQKESWRVETATKVSVWHMQNPDKQFEAITTALV